MAALSIQPLPVTGATVTFAAAAGGGDTAPVGSIVLVKNGSGSTITVTVAVPGNAYGIARPDYTISIAAGAIGGTGVLPQDLADPTDNAVHISYSSVTTVTVAAITG